jgi:ketosteroid isomerase-like protein
MSQENVAVVRRWIEVYNRRDIEALIEVSDADIEFRSIFAAIETGGVFRGYPGVFEYFKTLDDAYERFEVVPHDVLDAGAAALMVADADWRGKESGAEARTSIFVAFWLRAGKVLRVETFTDRAQALDAVGLRE